MSMLNEHIQRFIMTISKRKNAILALSSVMVFVTTYALILPAITLDREEAEAQGGIDIASEAALDEETPEASAAAEQADPSETGPSAASASETSGHAAGNPAGSREETISCEGEGFTVSAAYGTDAQLPAETELVAEEIGQDADEYEDYYQKALEAVQQEADQDPALNSVADLRFAKFYDISLQAGGQTVEPEAAVNVTIAYEEAIPFEQRDHVRIIHFTEDENGRDVVEVLDPESMDLTVRRSKMSETTFEAEGFSVYAVVYMVDLHYEVDGRTYDSSIPGGGCLSLTQLAEQLGLSEDATSFVAEVENVEFSDPKLVWTGRAEADTTVGGLKAANDLVSRYSAELTSDQIAEIDAQPVKAGDWALISLKPFTSEETLTVTMKNGDQWTVKVTDAQISTHVITADGEDYLITVTYGPEAGIPDGATLEARELLPGTAEYEEHLREAIDSLDAEQETLPELPDGVEWFTGDQEVKYARLFDVSILYEGQEIEPNAPVNVTVEYAKVAELNQNDQATVVHFAEDGTEVIDAVIDVESDGTTTISYEQDSFSAIATLIMDGSLPEDGEYVILANSNSGQDWYAMQNNGNGVKKTVGTADIATGSNVVISDECIWTLKKSGDNYIITNGNHRMILNLEVGTGSIKAVKENIDGGLIKIQPTTGNKYLFKNSNINKDYWLTLNSSNAFVGVQGQSNAQGFYLAKVYKGEAEDTNGIQGITIDEETRKALKAWRDSLINGERNPFNNLDKSAQVYEGHYNDRIYQIDLNAESAIRDFYDDIDLGFILDASNSMKFPAVLKPSAAIEDYYINAANMWELFYYYPSSDGQYYVIGDPTGTSTVYRLYWNNTARQWYYEDASGVSGGNVSGKKGPIGVDNVSFSNGGSGPFKIYVDGYDATTDKDENGNALRRRVDYLNYSLRTSTTVLQKIVEATGSANDESSDVRVAWNSFAYKIMEDHSTFESLKVTPNSNLPIAINVESGMEGGTSQDYGLNNARSFDWELGSKKYAILITDGAAVKNSKRTGNDKNDSEQMIQSKVLYEAEQLKKQGVTLITVGLSTKNVKGGSNLLKYIASDINGQKQFYSADNADDLQYILLQILQTIMQDGTIQGEATDTIDPAFYPVKKDGTPIQAGTYDESGNPVTITPGYTKPYCVWEVDNTGTWKVTWKNLDIGKGEDGFHKTIYVKAKEDFLGGNKIPTNKEAKVSATSYTVYDEDGKKPKVHSISPVTEDFVAESPKVNVDELAMTNGNTSWTVYVDSTVDPMTQLRNLYDNIEVREVVNSSGTDQRMPYKEAMNAGRTEDAEERFPLSRLTGPLTEDQILTLLNTGVLELPYGTETVADGINAYGHAGLGTIRLTLNKDLIYAEGENRITASDKDGAGHTANKTGTVEQYVLTASYIPDSTGASTTYTNTVEGKAGEITGAMTSENTHDITVIQKGIKVTKVDKIQTGNGLKGAIFALYKVDANGTADVSAYNLPGTNHYTLVKDDLTVDADGVVNISPVIPDQESVTGKTVYSPNNSVGADQTDHDTVYYLVEKKAPNGGYVAMPGAVTFTLNLSDVKPDQLTGKDRQYHGSKYRENIVLYNWTQAATIKQVAEVGNGTEYLINDGESNDVYSIRIKNGKPTDITLLKVDQDTRTPIDGAWFRLIRGSESHDFSGLTVTNIGGEAATIEDYVLTDGTETTIKAVVVPASGIKIAGLTDGTYTLEEVKAPAGYVKTDSSRTFTVSNGEILDHQDEAKGFNFRVENEKGKPLPQTGGTGTTAIYLTGILLIVGSVLLYGYRRRKSTR